MICINVEILQFVVKNRGRTRLLSSLSHRELLRYLGYIFMCGYVCVYVREGGEEI